MVVLSHLCFSSHFHFYTWLPINLMCNTPVLTPFALNVHGVYIVMNHGVELKAKSPPSIWLCYVSANGIVVDGISWYTTPIKFCHHVNMHFKLNEPN